MKNNKTLGVVILAVLVSLMLPSTIKASEDGLRALPDPKNSKSLEPNSTRSGSLKVSESPKLESQYNKPKQPIASLTAQSRQQRISKLSETVIQRFTRLTERQENILNRVNSRIEILSSEGKNVSSLKSKSSEISKMLSKQKSSIEVLQKTFNELSTSNLHTKQQTVSKSVNDIVKQTNSTHSALKELVKSTSKLSSPKAK